jgi:hypothetical protein
MRLILLVLAAVGVHAQVPHVDAIMARVAENQAVARDQRKEWVFHQKQLLRMHRTNGRIAREEHREYTVTPGEKGFNKELARFEGKYERKGRYVRYTEPGYNYKDVDIDGDLIDDFSKDMTNDAQSRDGIGAGLFPLTAEEQSKYSFKLLASETWRGRPAYKVAFEPKKKSLEGGGFWKGEAWIDAGEYQPIQVSTKMASSIPGAVKILLGTNLKGLGFSVSYRKFADGVWFPVSYGGEFEVKALFFYKRNISISMVNDDFRKASVSSDVAFATGEK